MPHRGSPVSLLTAVRADFSRSCFCGLLESSGAAGRLPSRVRLLALKALWMAQAGGVLLAWSAWRETRWLGAVCRGPLSPVDGQSGQSRGEMRLLSLQHLIGWVDGMWRKAGVSTPVTSKLWGSVGGGLSSSVERFRSAIFSVKMLIPWKLS